MNRRQFLTAGSLAGIAGISPLAATAVGDESKQEYLELRQYRLHVGTKKNLLGNFLRKVGIPAMNRIGIGPVGIFSAMYGPNNPTLYVLLVHKSLDTVMNSASMLMDDKEYRKAGADFVRFIFGYVVSCSTVKFTGTNMGFSSGSLLWIVILD